MARRTHLLQLTPLAWAAVLLASNALAAGAGAPPDSGALSAAGAPRDVRVAQAEQLAEAAFAAYGQRDYRRALELYQQAWSAAPSADIAFNIARVYDRGLRDARSAIDYYQRCAAAPKVSPQRRLSAERRIHELQAQLPGTEPAASEPAVAGADAQLASAAPAGAAATAATVPAPLPDALASVWTPRHVSALVLGGAGVSALGVGLGFALSASSERAQWGRGCDGNACSSQSAVDAARSAGRKADIATVALASGVGLLGIGATLWFLGPAGSESSPRARLQLVPAGHATELAGTVSGHF